MSLLFFSFCFEKFVCDDVSRKDNGIIMLNIELFGFDDFFNLNILYFFFGLMYSLEFWIVMFFMCFCNNDLELDSFCVVIERKFYCLMFL